MPGSPLRGGNSVDTFAKGGIAFSDHHYTDRDGKFRASPPPELTKLYNQGPPSKLSIRADINSLKVQSHACGVYTLQKAQLKGKPVWKHCQEDLVICSNLINGEPGWTVTRFTTAGTSKQQHGMRVVAPDKDALPNKCKQGQWQEWNGRDWVTAPSVMCRATWHGWGLEKLDRTRMKFSPSSPEGAY